MLRKMGKGGTVLGLIGILLGAGGLIFGFIAWTNQKNITNIQSGQNIWYQYDENEYFSISPTITYYPIPNMSIIFTLQRPVALHLLFTCSVRVIPTASYVTARFHFMINNVRLDYPYTRVGMYQGDSSSYDYDSVVLQHFYDAFPAGTHNITVVVYGESVNALVRECALCIQSYSI